MARRLLLHSFVEEDFQQRFSFMAFSTDDTSAVTVYLSSFDVCLSSFNVYLLPLNAYLSPVNVYLSPVIVYLSVGIVNFSFFLRFILLYLFSINYP